MSDCRVIYVVGAFSAEPFEADYLPELAFTTKEAAREFIQNNKGVFGSGYFRWDEELEEMVSCEKDHPDSEYNYGYRYSSFIHSITLLGEF